MENKTTSDATLDALQQLLNTALDWGYRERNKIIYRQRFRKERKIRKQMNITKRRKAKRD